MIVSVRPDANGNICIFYEGDENVTQVIFENPDSDFKWSLRYLRRGDKRPYSVPLEEADGELIWTVSLTDTEKSGTGYAQLVGSAEGQTKHGKPCTVTVYKSLEKPGDVPAAEKAFGDAVAADAAKAVKAAEDAAASAQSAGADADKAADALKALEDGIVSGDFRGEKGDKGDTGPQGPKGDTGPQGPDGDTTAADAAAKAAEAAAQAAQTAAEASAGSAASAAESVGGFAGELAETKAALATAQKDLAKAQRAIRLQAKLTQGQVWDFEEDEQAAYQRTVPSGAHAGAVISYGGNTIAWNQLANDTPTKMYNMAAADGLYTASARYGFMSFGRKSLIPGHKYYYRIDIMLPDGFTAVNGTIRVDIGNAGYSSGLSKNIQASGAGEWQTVEADGVYSPGNAPNYIETLFVQDSRSSGWTPIAVRNPLACDLTLMYGFGNEPTTEEFLAMLSKPTYPYNAGTLVSASVDDVDVTAIDGAVSALPIPAAVQSLPGYGWSAGAVANTVERTEDGWQYVQRVGSRAYQDGDELTDGTTTYYALDTPITTDITDLMGDALDPFDVEPGGTITFHSPAADDGFELDVPAKIQYITKLSEVTADA